MDAAPLTIRPAGMADYDAICAIFAVGDAYHARLLPDVFRAAAAPARSREHVATFVDQPGRALLLAAAAGEVVGLVQLSMRGVDERPFLHPRPRAHVESLVVLEAWRGQGIGRALMAAAEKWGRERGAAHLELSVWLRNEAAAAWYRRGGFEPAIELLTRPIDPPDASA